MAAPKRSERLAAADFPRLSLVAVCWRSLLARRCDWLPKSSYNPPGLQARYRAPAVYDDSTYTVPAPVSVRCGSGLAGGRAVRSESALHPGYRALAAGQWLPPAERARICGSSCLIPGRYNVELHRVQRVGSPHNPGAGPFPFPGPKLSEAICGPDQPRWRIRRGSAEIASSALEQAEVVSQKGEALTRAPARPPVLFGRSDRPRALQGNQRLRESGETAATRPDSCGDPRPPDRPRLGAEPAGCEPGPIPVAPGCQPER